MTNAHSTLRNNKREIHTRTLDNLWTPVIPFLPKTKSHGKKGSTEEDEENTSPDTCKVLVPIGAPANGAAVEEALASKGRSMVRYVKKFSNGTAEEWCEWREAYENICKAGRIEVAWSKTRHG